MTGKGAKNASTPSSLSLYLDQIGRYPLLSEQEKTRIDEVLVSASSEEKAKARELLIAHNLRLVIPIAERYARLHPGSLLDLIEEGNLALSQAAANYRPGKASFSTYATICIEYAVKSAARGYDQPYTIPKKKRDLDARIYASLAKLSLEQGHVPSNDDIYEDLEGQVRLEDIIEALSMPSNGEDIVDEIASGEDLASSYSEDAALEATFASLSKLSQKEQFVLIHAFGLDGQGKWTLSEIGAALGVSKERARQIKEAALFKLERRP